MAEDPQRRGLVPLRSGPVPVSRRGRAEPGLADRGLRHRLRDLAHHPLLPPTWDAGHDRSARPDGSYGLAPGQAHVMARSSERSRVMNDLAVITFDNLGDARAARRTL